jgi:hypothetical protein
MDQKSPGWLRKSFFFLNHKWLSILLYLRVFPQKRRFQCAFDDNVSVIFRAAEKATPYPAPLTVLDRGWWSSSFVAWSREFDYGFETVRIRVNVNCALQFAATCGMESEHTQSMSKFFLNTVFVIKQWKKCELHVTHVLASCLITYSIFLLQNKMRCPYAALMLRCLEYWHNCPCPRIEPLEMQSNTKKDSAIINAIHN